MMMTTDDGHDKAGGYNTYIWILIVLFSILAQKWACELFQPCDLLVLNPVGDLLHFSKADPNEYHLIY